MDKLASGLGLGTGVSSPVRNVWPNAGFIDNEIRHIKIWPTGEEM